MRARHALRWQDQDAAVSYRFRPTYPPETFDILLSLMGDAPSAVLDIGCGTGNLARPLAPRVGRVDAVDLSNEMIDAGRGLLGGNAPNLRWHAARAEDVVLTPPYGLIVGGESFHWIDASVALPRFGAALAANGVLASVSIIQPKPMPWDSAVKEVIVRHSTGYAPFDVFGSWAEAELFQPLGERITSPLMTEQRITDFIAAFHAMASLTRAYINANAFDREIQTVMTRHCPDGVVRRPIAAQIAWGRPLASS